MGQESCDLAMQSGCLSAMAPAISDAISQSSHFPHENDGFDGSTKKMKIASLTEDGLGRSIRVDSLMNDEPLKQPDPDFVSPSDYKELYLRESAKNQQLLQWVTQLQSGLSQHLRANLVQPEILSSPPARILGAGEKDSMFREGRIV